MSGLNQNEAARFLGLASGQVLANMRYKRRGPVYHKVGRRVVYYERDLLSFLEKRRIDPEGGCER